MMGLVGWGLFRLLPAHLGYYLDRPFLSWLTPRVQDRIYGIALFLFVACVCGWIYYWLTKTFKMPESEYLDRAMKKLDRRKRPISVVEADDEAG